MQRNSIAAKTIEDDLEQANGSAAHGRVKRHTGDSEAAPQRTIKVKKLIRKVTNKTIDNNASTNSNNNVKAPNNSANDKRQSTDCNNNSCELHSSTIDIDALANIDNYNANNTRINDKANSKRSHDNTSDEHNKNTQDDGTSIESPKANVRLKKRRIIPIRRTRINALASATLPNPIEPTPVVQNRSHASTTLEATSPQPPIEHKRKLFVKRRRVTAKPTNAPNDSDDDSSDELLSVSAALAEKRPVKIPRISSTEPIEMTAVTTEMRLSTKHRTYTYMVTRVHDNQSEIISSTLVRDQITTITDTITKTICVTPTATRAYAHIQPTRIH